MVPPHSSPGTFLRIRLLAETTAIIKFLLMATFPPYINLFITYKDKVTSYEEDILSFFLLITSFSSSASTEDPSSTFLGKKLKFCG